MFNNDKKLDTIFHECRQCGLCCRSYSKVLLKPDEVDTIKKLGGHVGLMIALNDLRDKPLDELIKDARYQDKIYMIHPDNKGCIFLGKKNNKYFCKIYHYRPESCKGFRCNMADKSIETLLLDDPNILLGTDKYGRKL